MIRISRFSWRFAVALTVLSLRSALADEANDELKQARSLLLRGRYEESAEAYVAPAEKHPIPAALGLSRCRMASGETDEARKVVHAALEKHPASSELHAELAVLEFEARRFMRRPASRLTRR